ncbi:MAG: 2-hydroxyacid dehydrogenase [Halioglobus sp.]
MVARVLLSQPLAGDAIERLAGACQLETLGAPLTAASIEGMDLGDVAGLVCLLTDRVDAALLARLPALRFVSSISVGVDHVDVHALTERGIPLGHTPGVLVDATADTAFSLLLCAARRIAEGDRYIRAGQWQPDKRWAPDFFLGKDVSGATLGILGLGDIGQAVARRGAGFGMRVISWTRSGREVPGVEAVSLDELLSRSDFLSVNVALSEETRGLLGAEAIVRMKPGAVLVNTARGGIVDEVALAEALDRGHLYAAGLDVFEREPLAPDSPLLAHPRIVLAPHVGSATVKTRQAMVALAVDNALDALAGRPMARCVNPSVYPLPGVG